jgi:hypothetical protein
MNMKDKLIDLRAAVSIGISRGLEILKRTNGELNEAIELSKLDLINDVKSNTGVSDAIARQLLEANHFDVTKVIKEINNSKLSLTQRILKTFKNKEHALNGIVDAIEKTYQLKREYSWLDYNELEKLDWEVYCLVSTMEWINYSDNEGIDYGLSFHIDSIIENLVKLGLASNADRLRNSQLNLASYSIAEYGSDKENIMDHLFEMVVSKIQKFP